LAGGADRAAAAMAHDAFQQRTAYDIPGHRELVDQLLADGINIVDSYHPYK
jgi:hypothetical protein